MRRLNKGHRVFMLVLFAVLLLQACVTQDREQNCKTVPEAGWCHTSIVNDSTLQALESYGVMVMRLGDNVVITIPSQQLFDGYSVQISHGGDDILNQILLFIAPMNKVNMTIMAYAAATTQAAQDLLLTQWQAQAVSNYLWDHHVDARMISTMGYGGGHSVQSRSNQVTNEIIAAHSDYRVEIMLKDYVQ